MPTHRPFHRTGPRLSARKRSFVFVPQHYQATDNELIEDLRRVARLLGERTLSQRVYGLHSRFGHYLFFRRFGSWNVGLKKAGLEPSHHKNTPANEIIFDVRRVARKRKLDRLTQQQYRIDGLFSVTTIQRRFGSWAKLMLIADLKPSRVRPAAKENALLENLYQLWRHLGRQPKIVDLVPPHSVFRIRPYQRCFGGFQNALRALEKWSRHENDDGHRHKTSRGIRPRLLYQILRRDHFKCRACGRSPANEPGVKLQVDHIKPWSAGGETVEVNLQTLCQRCNIGKSNL